MKRLTVDDRGHELGTMNFFFFFFFFTKSKLIQPIVEVILKSSQILQYNIVILSAWCTSPRTNGVSETLYLNSRLVL